jgi:integrase
MVATYIYAGLRREAALWLTTDDVDFERRLILVRAKTIDGEFWQPKTRKNRVVPISDALYGILADGLSDRDKVKEKRWQAGYDLALGRVLALKVRTDAYNIMLAQAKTGMKFKDPRNDTWVLRPSDDVSATGDLVRKLTRWPVVVFLALPNAAAEP